jgi:hypothetical protein
MIQAQFFHKKNSMDPIGLECTIMVLFWTHFRYEIS